MNRKVPIIMLLVVLSASAVYTQALTRERLLMGDWGGENLGRFSWTISFTQDGTFEIRPPGLSHGARTRGTYRMGNNSVILSVQVDDFDFFDGEATATYYYGHSSDSIFAVDYLHRSGNGVYADYVFWDSNSIPVGQTRMIRGAEAVVEYHQEVRSSVDLSIRSLPGTHGRRYTFVDPPSEFDPGGEYGWVPEGTRLWAVARSRTTETIDGLTHFWYFVILPEYLDASPYLKELDRRSDLNGGWMFGGYLSGLGK